MATLGVLAAAPAAASAVTIGSDLARAGDATGYCTGDGPGSGCTVLQLSIGTTDLAVPADGVVTRWTVRDAGGDVAPRVLDGPAGARQVVAGGPTVTIPGPGVQSFSVGLPVRAGQRVGLELGDTAFVPFHYRDEITTGEEYVPPLTDVPSAPIPGAALERTYEISYNFTVEPDADHDGLGDESQDPDHGGCPTSAALLSSGGTTVTRSGTGVSACRAGVTTALGSIGKTTKLKLYTANGDSLALVKVAKGRSSIQVFNLVTRRRTFSTTRTFTKTYPDATAWTVTDLVVAPNGDAAWIARPRGAKAYTTVWVRHGARVQAIDQGNIRPTSLTISDDASGIYYLGADGQQRNSSFGS
jgi:hypothetical protein